MSCPERSGVEFRIRVLFTTVAASGAAVLGHCRPASDRDAVDQLSAADLSDTGSLANAGTDRGDARALRTHGVTVIGSTSRRVALTQADTVVVLSGGVAVDVGSWPGLADQWDHLAG